MIAVSCIIIVFGVTGYIAYYTYSTSQYPASMEDAILDPWAQNRANSIYCHGELLKLVQTSNIFPDSKTFVDMPMKEDPEMILKKFKEMMRSGQPSQEQIRTFVGTYFQEAGGELDAWEPDDWTDSPSLLDKIIDSELRQWAGKLNDLWKILGRKMKPMENPERHSLISVPHPFIVPGDRFREFYYWDTYWIVGGLLAVDMAQTVRGILSNFLEMVDRFGFVPNGGRIYYLNRSQPPLLSPMVHAYFKHTDDIQFVRDNIRLLEKEHEFWIQNRTVKVDLQGKSHTVAKYDAMTSSPRPEGYKEDFDLIKDMQADAAKAVLSHTVSACESGWDFSTRWFGDDRSLKSIRTRDIAPVDLNVYLCWSEQILSELFGHLGNEEKQQLYQAQAERRKSAIDDLFWNDDLGAWFDLDLETSKQRTEFYPSSLFPILANCTKIDKNEKTHKILQYLKKNNVTDFPGGVPSSLINSGQQWDFPNAWSPLVHFLVESLSNLQSTEAKNLAKDVARTWILSNHEAWKKHEHMYEKYDVQTYGAPGGGGEYDVQLGFGWTNGVILMLLDKYGGDINIK